MTIGLRSDDDRGAGTVPSSMGDDNGKGAPMAGRLTTHVLDTTRGGPAAGVRIELFRLEGHSHRLLVDARTNADGRVDGPLLDGDEMRPGTYELTFHVGDYFRAQRAPLAEPPFLDRVPVRFGIASPDAHYHIPLLVSAHGYTTYRGS